MKLAALGTNGSPSRRNASVEDAHPLAVHRERALDVLVVVERRQRADQRERVHVERLADALHGLDHRRGRDGVADAETREAVELRERAQRHDRHVAVATQRDGVGVLRVLDVVRVRVVGDHEELPRRERAQEGLPGGAPEDRARRVVRDWPGR